jgi:hypothetical protein
LLVGAGVAVPDDQLGAVGGVAGEVVEAAAGQRVDQGGVGLCPPDLCAGAVAVPQLDEGAVGGGGALSS